MREKKKKGNFTYLPELLKFLQIPPKNLHLVYQTLVFSHFAHSVQKMPILPLTDSKITIPTQPKTKGCSFEIRGKISIFLYGRGKMRENQSLIHLSENF